MDINNLTTKELKKLCNEHNKILKQELENSDFKTEIKIWNILD